MSKAISGLKPHAKLHEVSRDLYDYLHHLGEGLDGEYVFVTVVHGDTYIAERVTDDDAPWDVMAETEETGGALWEATDAVGADLPHGEAFVDVLGETTRYLVSITDD